MTAVAVASLYTLLGVARNASAAEIKAAYRKVAQRLHPDRGGSQDEFDALFKAKELLLDPKRRAKYDATGAADEPMPSNDHIKVMEIIDGMIAGFMDDDKVDFRTFDIVAEMKKLAVAGVNNAVNVRADILKQVERMENIAARFKFKKGTSLAPLKAAMKGRIAGKKRRILSVENDITMFKTVEIALNTLTYTVDEDPMQTWMSQAIGQAIRGYGFGPDL